MDIKYAIDRVTRVGYEARITGSHDQVQVILKVLEGYHDWESINVGTLKEMLKRSDELYELDMRRRMP